MDNYIWINGKPYRYVQYKSGLKLHLGHVVDDDKIHARVLCGRRFDKFRMSINVPLAHACKSCVKQANRLRAN